MRRWTSAVLVIVLLAGALGGFAGCGQQEPAARTSLKIGVALYDQYDTFVGELMTHFMAAIARKEEDANVTITVLKESADGNQLLQNNQVDALIESGCDILCVNLVDRADAAVIIERAITENIPVVFFNRELVEEDLYRSDNFFYVGAQAMESGRMQGEIVVNLWTQAGSEMDKNGDGVMQYVMLEGEFGHQDAIVRTETALKTVSAGRGGAIPMERLEDEIANWVRAEADSKMTDWIKMHENNIEVVFANNDDMALGAIDALERAEVPMSDWPVVVGIDGTSIGIEAVRLGKMSGTVLNDSVGQAEKMLEVACALWFEDEMPELQDGKYIRLPYQPVTPENIQNFLKETD